MSSTDSSSASAGQDWSLYAYGVPCRAAAILFSVLFFTSCVTHCVQLRFFGVARYSVLLAVAAAIYTAGMVMREVSSFSVQDVGLFISTIVLVYVAAPIYAAVNYLVLGRILHYVPSKSPLHPGRVVTTFLALDVIVEILTGQGSSRIANYDDPDNVQIGRVLIEASLVLQLVLYLCFLYLAWAVYRRCMKDGIHSIKFRYAMRVMFISTSLILLRTSYRIAEAFLGPNGYTQTYEWPFYLFDVTPLLINSWMLNIWHPSIFLPPSSRVYLGADGVTERMGPGWTDKRPFLATLLDPFDIAGIINKRDNRTRFWDDEDSHPVFAPNLEKSSQHSHGHWLWRKVGLGYVGDLCSERNAQKDWIKENAAAMVSRA